MARACSRAEGSGGSSVTLLDPPRFCVEGPSLLASRAAKPWQGRALEGSGGSSARFWTPAVLRGRLVTVGLEGRETVARACSRAEGSSRGLLLWQARFWTPAVVRGRAVTFGLEAREAVAGACSIAVEEHALTRADMHAHAHAQRALINAHLWRHTNERTRTHTHQSTPTSAHAYTHLQDCMSDDSSPREKT